MGCSGNCQLDAVEVVAVEGLHYYGVNTRFCINMVVTGGYGGYSVTEIDSPGGWGVVVAAFLGDEDV